MQGDINEIFVNEILGMKLGEVKTYITWTMGSDLIEYYKTTILKIVLDSTPETTPTQTTQTVDFFTTTSILSLIIISLKKDIKNRIK